MENFYEKKRIYTFESGCRIILENVVDLSVSDSGNHRLKTLDEHGVSHLHIVPPEWIHIEIEAEEWTF